MDSPSLDGARSALTDQEGIPRKNAQRLIGVWSNDSVGGFAGSAAVAHWARYKGVAGVVWTALGPNFPEVGWQAILRSSYRLLEDAVTMWPTLVLSCSMPADSLRNPSLDAEPAK
jgi:hypothetical protein